MRDPGAAFAVIRRGPRISEVLYHVQPFIPGSLSALQDPRQTCKVVYPLRKMLLIVLCATLAGAEDFAEMERRAVHKIEFLRRLQPFARGVPSHDTLNGVMNALTANHAFRPSPASSWSRPKSNATAGLRARRYFLSSARLDASTFARAIRAHWASRTASIESSMSSFMTTSSGCALSTDQHGHDPHAAMNIIKAIPDKASIKVRRKNLGWDDDYLFTAITNPI